MSKLPRSAQKAISKAMLRMDVEDLEAAYHSALKGLAHRQEEIEAMSRAELGIGPDEEWPDRNHDDSDDPISELYERAGEMDAQAQRGAPMVRKAFLIALFHAWERHLNARLKRGNYDLTVARREVIRDGHGMQWQALRELQLAANCAKHGPGESCHDLYPLRPDLFPRATAAAQATERTLVISNEALDAFFKAVFVVSR